VLAYHPEALPNQVLNILDTESSGAVRGIERAVLEFKWRHLGSPVEQLAPSLDTLLREGLLRVVGVWLRLTRAGYECLTAPHVAAAPPLPQAQPQAFGRPTEYGVRGKLLGVFRTQGLGSGGKLSAAELNRYWAVAGYRAGDLRSGLDLLMRDGHSKVGRFSKTVFRLESDGDRYARGDAAPEWLEKEAIALEEQNLRQQSIPDRVLCALAARQFIEQSGLPRPRAWSEVDYLLERYELPEFARFHAYELLHRLGYAVAAPGNALQLTDKGYELVQSSEGETAQWLIRQSMKAGERADSALPRAQA